jgi:hypothetical protein
MYSDSWLMIDLSPTVLITPISPPPTQSYFKSQLLKKPVFAGCSKRSRGEAREKSILRLSSGQARGVVIVRRSEVIERNEAYGSFSAAC